MSYYSLQTHVFLPSYILDYVTKEDEPKVDCNLFLSKASNPQIMEMILAFYPHFTFKEAVKEDREVLQKTFLEMVAGRISHVVPPSNNKTSTHFHAQLDFPIFGPHESHTTVAPGSEINCRRIDMFNNSVFTYLKSGQYCNAGENLVAFIKNYKHLNRDEIYEIKIAEEEASEGLDESLRSLQDAHEAVKAELLLLSKPNMSPSDHQNVHCRLKSANIILQSREKTFQGLIRDLSYLSALASYYSEEIGPEQSSASTCVRAEMEGLQ